ncbi:TonB-dependent receptor plug domain-containing protein [Shewanella decolorationis]|uniref:Dependent receptor n=1 Tax=Shewanella decolorationis S12 TaxID=1353536 RepID=A0ABN0PT19_9GAMM|nr:TonB-dependent receptor [Shewanella decolorationis]ESE43290.1 dependent receptor [Shewanella decolorationis S12]GLR31006.1 TonB-dependent receptor [Shewanella decolorationis]
MHNNNFLATSIRLALTSSLVLGALSVSSVSIAEEDTAKVERIEVTGSRIKRSDLEGASPVTTITTEDMKLEGNFTVADALRNSNLNTFGSFSERSGSSAQSQATIDLRGAGSDRTLVLIDGKRFPGSPTLGGGSANLNAIPMAAVERIEILTDGGSSTYGSDAIAGVVNIIMKKNYQGLEFNVGGGSREADGGLTSKEFSVVAGYQMDKGNITFSFDHQDRKGIADGDRPYTAASMSDLNGDGIIQAYTETTGWSIYGATVASPDFSETQASPLCDDLAAQYGSDVFRKVAADDDWGPGSTYCMYANANVSYNKASTDRNTVYVDANYEVAENIEWFGRTMITQGKSFGRYAPPAAAWNKMSADNPNNPYGAETTGYWRWVGIGTRDGNVDDYNQDYLTGLRGTLPSLNDATWEFYYHYNKADNKSIGEYYLSYAGLAYNEQNGIDLGSEEGIANMKATTLTQDTATFHQYNAGIGFDAFELPGGAVAHYFGMEYFEQDFASVYDAQSEAGLIGGSAGNSASGDRQVWAAFYEAVLPITDTIELNVAARYDDYSDFGTNVAPKAAIRWQALDNLVVRASYSEAFRAPRLDQLNAADTFSAESGKDYPFCGSNGQESCPTKQFDTYISSNDSLDAETSDYLNLGIAWDVVEEFSVKLDYFNLNIDNAISQRSVTNVIRGIANGQLTPDSTFYVERAPSSPDGSLGRVLKVGTGYANGDKLSIEGIDLAFAANFATGIGDFGINWNNSFVLDYTSEQVGGAAAQNTAGWEGQPDYKSVLTTTYTIADHKFSWNMNYTSGTYAKENAIQNGSVLVPEGDLDSWLIHNITYTYDIGNFGAITLMVNNLTDEDPVLNNGKYENADLYNNYGREYRASYTVKF